MIGLGPRVCGKYDAWRFTAGQRFRIDDRSMRRVLKQTIKSGSCRTMSSSEAASASWTTSSSDFSRVGAIRSANALRTTTRIAALLLVLGRYGLRRHRSGAVTLADCCAPPRGLLSRALRQTVDLVTWYLD